jgi:serine/threonine protein kinase
MNNNNDTLLGRGAFGKVVRHWSTTLQKHVARKVFTRKCDFDSELRWFTVVSAKRTSRYSNTVVMLYTSFCDSRKFYMDLELGAGTLYDVAFNRDRRPSKCPQLSTSVDVRNVVVECIRGLTFLHETVGIVHCDIKPQNILRLDNGAIKICDLGMCAYVGERVNFGTIGFAAPELYFDSDGTDDGGKCDVFSLGVCLFEVFEGQQPTRISKVMMQQYNQWNEEVDLERQAARLDVLKTSGNGFYRSAFRVAIPSGANVAAIGYGVSHLVADMCTIYVAQRPSSTQCLARLRLLEQVEKNLDEQHRTRASTAASTSGGTAAVGAAFRAAQSPPPSVMEIDLLSASSANNVRQPNEFLAPLPPPQIIRPAVLIIPAVASQLNTPVVALASPPTPVHPRPVLPTGSDSDILLNIAEAIGIPNASVLAGIPAPVFVHNLQQHNAAVASAGASAEASQASLLSSEEATAVTEDERKMIGKLAKAARDWLNVEKRPVDSVFNNLRTEEEKAFLTRMRKSGEKGKINNLATALLKKLFSDLELSTCRQRIFELLVERKREWWRSAQPVKRAREGQQPSPQQ